MADDRRAIEELRSLAASAGIKRIHVLAWRDLDDPEAGGSELHAHEILRLWAEADLDINMRTSFAPGTSQVEWRDGYRVIRKAGRYMVFPRAAFSEMVGWHGARDALVEIWNGMPFLSPVWSRGPKMAWLHHVHDTMWEMSLPPRLAKLGRNIEFKYAPPAYKLTRTPIVTLSQSSKQQLVSKLGFREKSVSVVPVGISAAYSPGGTKSTVPLVVACGRLVAVKQFHLLVEAIVNVRATVADAELVIVGEGYERGALEQQIEAAGATSYIKLVGFVSESEKIDWYRRAWVLASASAHEGWGMTVTEAAACGTPSVATDIAGHRDAVADGTSGLLVKAPEIAAALTQVLGDSTLRQRLTSGALEHSRQFTWAAAARDTLKVLCAQAQRYSR